MNRLDNSWQGGWVHSLREFERIPQLKYSPRLQPRPQAQMISCCPPIGPVESVKQESFTTVTRKSLPVKFSVRLVSADHARTSLNHGKSSIICLTPHRRDP